MLELRAPAIVNAILVLLYVVCCVYSVTVSIAIANIGPHYLGLPVSLCTSFLIIQLSHYIAGRSDALKRVLSFFGRNSLIVLCVHLVFLDTGFERFLLYIGLERETNVLQFVNLAVQLATCAGVSALIPKTRFLKRVFC